MGEISIDDLKVWDGAVWAVFSHWEGWAFPHWSEGDKSFYFTCKGHEFIRRRPEDYQSGHERRSFIAYPYNPHNESIGHYTTRTHKGECKEICINGDPNPDDPSSCEGFMDKDLSISNKCSRCLLFRLNKEVSNEAPNT